MGEDVFDRLHAKLSEEFTWPDTYMFKFIMKNEEPKINAVLDVFEEGTNYELTPSKKNNYVSMTIIEVMIGPDAIIEKYKKVTKIEGVIAL